MPRPVSFIGRLSAGGRVRYGRFHCITDTYLLLNTISFPSTQEICKRLDGIENSLKKLFSLMEGRRIKPERTEDSEEFVVSI